MHSYHDNGWKLTIKTNGNICYGSLDHCLDQIEDLVKEDKINRNVGYRDRIEQKIKTNNEFEDDLFWLRGRS